MHVSSVPRRRNIGLRSIATYGCFVAAFVLALLGLTRVISALLHIPTQLDFAAYYVAARMLNAHVALYQFTPLDEVTVGVAGIQHSGYLYPPFFAALLRPLALLPYRQAETIWFLSNVVMFVPVCVLLLHIIGVAKRWSLAMIVVGLLLPAVYDTWLLGQVSVLLTLLLLGSLALTMHPAHHARKDFLAGLLLGVAAMIKIYPLVLSAIYLRHRRWSALAGMGAGLVGAGVIGILFGGGWSSTHYWLTEVLLRATSMSPFPSNQSLRGVVARFLTVNTFQVAVLTKDNYVTFTLMPLFNSPTVSTIVIAVGSIMMISITAWALLRPSAFVHQHLLAWDIAIGTTVMLVITPVVWDLYYVHLLLPLALLASVARTDSSARLVVAGVCLLLALQRYWRYVLLYAQSPWLMLCGFLAVMLLWATMLIIRGRPNEQYPLLSSSNIG